MAGSKFTEMDGRQLAVDMLREIGTQWNEQDLSAVPDGEITEACIDFEPDVMRRYLRAVQEKASPELERGFLCVLSAFIGGEVSGCGLDLAWFEKSKEHRRG